jgi:hypothetical protein
MPGLAVLRCDERSTIDFHGLVARLVPRWPMGWLLIAEGLEVGRATAG